MEKLVSLKSGSAAEQTTITAALSLLFFYNELHRRSPDSSHQRFDG
jgi:hypothetical protein